MMQNRWLDLLAFRPQSPSKPAPRQRRRLGPWRFPKPQHWPILLVVLVGSALRLAFITKDLPFIYEADEPLYVGLAVGVLRDMNPNPQWFGAPGTTLIYLLGFAYALLFGVGFATGHFRSVEDFRALYQTDPTLFYLSGRTISCMSAIASIVMVYLIAKRLKSTRTGLVAAMILALSPAHISLSQVVRADVLMVFLLLVAFWFCLDILESPSAKPRLLAGVFLGLATVTKYPAVTFAPVIVLAHILTEKSRHLHRLILAGAASVGGAFLASPFVFLDFKRVLHDVALENRSTHLGSTGDGFLSNLAGYVTDSLPSAVSYPGFVLLVLSPLLWYRLRTDRQIVLLVSFPIIFTVFISSLNLWWDRWFLPAVPFAAILVALSLDRLVSYLKNKLDPGIATAVGLAWIFAIGFPLLRVDWLDLQDLAAPHTRTLSQEWILENIPRGSHILVETYSPPLPWQHYRLYSVERGRIVEEPRENMGRRENWLPTGLTGGLRNADELEQNRIDFVVLSNFYDRFQIEQERYPEVVETYERILERSTLVWEIEAEHGRYRGQDITVYKVNAPAAASEVSLEGHPAR